MVAHFYHHFSDNYSTRQIIVLSYQLIISTFQMTLATCQMIVSLKANRNNAFTPKVCHPLDKPT